MSNLESNIFITFVIVSCIILPITDAFQVGKIKAVYNSAHDNKFHNDNAIGIYLAKSMTSCFVECAKDLRCISFFFNSLTKSCILQADPFVYTVMTKSGTGWKFYLTQDRKFVIDSSIPFNIYMFTFKYTCIYKENMVLYLWLFLFILSSFRRNVHVSTSVFISLLNIASISIVSKLL